jgi:hypothetical protein
MKRPLIKYTLRSLLICVLVFSIALAFIVHLRSNGIREAKSVNFLNSSGCWILPEYQLSTVLSTTQPGRYIQTRSWNSAPESPKFSWLFGQDYYTYHSDVLLEEKPKRIDELVTHLKNLRKLKYVFYVPKALNDDGAEELQSKLPGVHVVSALKLGPLK